MNITSRCTGCGATSLNGVLKHLDSCVLKQNDVQHGVTPPAVSIKFDTPEESKAFMDNLKTGGGLVISNPTTPSEADGELRFRIMDYLDEHEGECNVDLSYGIVELFHQELAGLVSKLVANRFEVINHLPDGSGREIVVWKDEPFEIETSIQDDGRTVKIFLTDEPQLTHKDK